MFSLFFHQRIKKNDGLEPGWECGFTAASQMFPIEAHAHKSSNSSNLFSNFAGASKPQRLV
jgi:hypothetical protein